MFTPCLSIIISVSFRPSHAHATFTHHHLSLISCLSWSSHVCLSSPQFHIVHLTLIQRLPIITSVSSRPSHAHFMLSISTSVSSRSSHAHSTFTHHHLSLISSVSCSFHVTHHHFGLFSSIPWSSHVYPSLLQSHIVRLMLVPLLPIITSVSYRPSHAHSTFTHHYLSLTSSISCSFYFYPSLPQSHIVHLMLIPCYPLSLRSLLVHLMVVPRLPIITLSLIHI